MSIKHVITYTTQSGRTQTDITADDYTAFTFINDITRKGATDVKMYEIDNDTAKETLLRVPKPAAE